VAGSTPRQSIRAKLGFPIVIVSVLRTGRQGKKEHLEPPMNIGELASAVG
jgi:hypothetical protein